MSTAVADETVDVCAPAPSSHYRFSKTQFEAMTALGVLSKDDPVDLIDGLIVIRGHSTLAPHVPVVYDNGDIAVLPVRRFTVREYDKLGRIGVLTPEDHIELLEGWLVKKMTRNAPHDAVFNFCFRLLSACLPEGWHTRGQTAIVADFSEPEPDIAIVRGGDRAYMKRHPRPREVGLVVEVADSSLEHDREQKAPLYARVGIPQYWIINIPDQQLEVYSQPTGPDPEPRYTVRTDLKAHDIVPLILDGVEIARLPVSKLLP